MCVCVCVCVCRYRPSAGLFPLIVSQDCGHDPTAQAIAQYSDRVKHIKVREGEELVGKAPVQGG